MKSTGHTVAFESPLNFEYSSGFTVPISDLAKSEMELFTPNGELCETEQGLIEWVYNVGTADEDVVHIGVSWEGWALVDYDGVFELPSQAIPLLEKAGVQVGPDFRPEPE
ncbi:hypothetical protein [Fibrisoma limi]|nr:hypothetical protein [Fibrisoma limi]